MFASSLWLWVPLYKHHIRCVTEYLTIGYICESEVAGGTVLIMLLLKSPLWWLNASGLPAALCENAFSLPLASPVSCLTLWSLPTQVENIISVFSIFSYVQEPFLLPPLRTVHSFLQFSHWSFTYWVVWAPFNLAILAIGICA